MSGSSNELHQKIVEFLSTQFARKDRQAVDLHLFYCPGPGSRDEELESWSRSEKPEFFDTLALVEKIAQTIITRAEEHVDSFATGRHRYVIQVTQHLGGRPRWPFSLQPRHSLADDPDGTALMTEGGPAGRRGTDALVRGFDTAMRSNTLMFTGAVGMAQTANRALSEENMRLREENFDLRRKLDDAESTREERRWKMEQASKNDAVKGEAIKQVFQFGQIAITKALGGPSGGEQVPPRVMILLKTLKDSVEAQQVEALSKIFSPGQLITFIEIMKLVESAEADQQQAQQAQQQGPNGSGAANGSNGHAHAR